MSTAGPRDDTAIASLDQQEDDDTHDDDGGDTKSEVEDKQGHYYVADEEEGLFEDEDDHKDAEGDETAIQEIEPSEATFGVISFHGLCMKLEKITKSAKQTRLPAINKLNLLMPSNGIKKLREPLPDGLPQTPFPYTRLLCPEKDSSREYYVKQKTLAKAYITAHNWPNDHPLAIALLYFQDPNKIAAAKLPPCYGDLSETIRQVLVGRIPDKPSSMTVADMNKALDELASFNHRGNLRPSNHDWEPGSTAAVRNKKGGKLGDLRAAWIKRFITPNDSRRLSPLEHKWLARIVLKEMKINLGFDKILCWFDPSAPALFSGHNSLRGVCKIISQPGFKNQLTSGDDEGSHNSVQSVAPYLRKSISQIQLGVPFSPMFSARTGFDRMLYEFSDKHRTYLKDPLYGKLDGISSPQTTSCMALEHPAFSMETKLDGERQIVHLSRDGLVKVHTRNANWFSDIYSPVLGPHLRAAFGHVKMDMILDGEILAWDNEKQASKETIPFGNNRTVAQLRADWMKYQGTLDTRDRNIHQDEKETKVIHMNSIWSDQAGSVPDLNGKDCWMQFIAFDIVYLEGDGAEELLRKVISPFIPATPGSLMSLECLDRKKILYHLIRPVDKFVEIVPTLVVSCDGKTYPGTEYFSRENPPVFMGRPLYSLDSAATFLHEMSDRHKAADRKGIEEARRNGLTNAEISQKRALAVGQHYKQVVDDQKQEGIIFKDLSTPYVLDKHSRALGYWRKFKPDFYNGSVASDIDLVIIGAYFATGLRNAGRPSGYLCACVYEDRFVPLCKVNAGSISYEKSNVLLRHTGYPTEHSHGPLDTGKWFTYDNATTKECPEFVSPYSFAVDATGTLEGWKPNWEDYPDLWINPEDSVVLTLNAGEICPSTAFPSRVTLRFPRITDVRYDKGPQEVETLQFFWDKYEEVMSQRAGDNSEGAFQKDNSSVDDAQMLKERFWTEERYLASGKGKRKKRPKVLHAVSNIPQNVEVESSAFKGVIVVPLEGTYILGGLEVEEAQDEGWFDEASGIRDHVGVRTLIKKHGGTVMLSPGAKLLEQGALVIGGNRNDPRVVNFTALIEEAQSKDPELRMKKKLTIADQDTLAFAKCKGVVRWTFILSVLSKWRALDESKTNNASILETRPDLLIPDSLDCLTRPKCPSGNVTRELCQIDIRNITKMRRLLHEVAEATTSEDEEEKDSTWQDLCKKSLDPTDCWIMRSSNQTLWTYQEDSAIIQETAVYLDVFADPRSHSNDLSAVDPYEYSLFLSVVPLLRVAGAFIETRLCGRVTHILCGLRDDCRKLPFEEATPEHFVDAEHGKRLMEEVKKSPLYPECCPDFVSPLWVREEVWVGQKTD